MKVALLHHFQQPLVIQSAPDPVAPVDGVVIQVSATGICRSDWHVWQGHFPEVQLPLVPGHEFAGTIVSVGTQLSGWQVGDRVTVPFAMGCGVCSACRRGDTHICDQDYQPGYTGWGSFAEYLAIPRSETNLVALPEEIDFVSAASLGCRFTTAYRAVIDQGRLRPGEWVAVHGCGGLGLSAVMIAITAGAQVIGVDINDQALEIAAQFGASHTLNPQRTPDIAGAIQELTAGGAHLSLDALGHPETCRNSLLCLRKRGRHIQVGLLVGAHALPCLPMGVVLSKELELIGSHGMPAHAYPKLLEMIVSGRLQPQRLVRERITLPSINSALSAMSDYKAPGIAVIDRF